MPDAWGHNMGWLLRDEGSGKASQGHSGAAQHTSTLTLPLILTPRTEDTASGLYLTGLESTIKSLSE